MKSWTEAHGYIKQNISPELTPDDHDQAVDDALRVHPASWRNWLERGSKEDWSDRVGVLRTPALVIAGEDDAQLGPEGQRKFTMPHDAARCRGPPGRAAPRQAPCCPTISQTRSRG